LRIVRFYSRIDLCNRSFDFVGGFGVVKINTDISQDKIGPHVHGQYFVDMLDAVIRLQDITYVVNNGSVGTFTDEQALGFIRQPDSRADQNQADDDRGNRIKYQDAGISSNNTTKIVGSLARWIACI